MPSQQNEAVPVRAVGGCDGLSDAMIPRIHDESRHFLLLPLLDGQRHFLLSPLLDGQHAERVLANLLSLRSVVTGVPLHLECNIEEPCAVWSVLSSRCAIGAVGSSQARPAKCF